MEQLLHINGFCWMLSQVCVFLENTYSKTFGETFLWNDLFEWILLDVRDFWKTHVQKQSDFCGAICL